MRPSYQALLLTGCAGLLIGAAGCSVRTYSGADVVIDEPAAPPAKSAAATQSVAAKAEAGPPFRLPDDAAGKLLGRVLPPTSSRDPLPDLPRRPALFPAPPRVAESSVSLPPSPAALARLPQPPRSRPVQPEFVLDESLAGLDRSPTLPQEPAFATSPAVRLDSEDVAIPPPLPVLGTPVADRIPVDDVTTEASTAAVLAAPLPHRTAPAPYVRLSVPRPFEHRESATDPVPLPEGTTPALAAPRLPK